MKFFLIAGAVNGLLAVALGAFGAHMLEGRVADKYLDTWQTAVQYQMFHSIGLIAVAPLSRGFVSADLGLAVGGERADLGDLGGGGDLAGLRPQLGDDGGNRLVDAAPEVHRVHPGGHGLRALADDGLGQHGRGGGAVAGLVVGLRGHLAHHLRAHVLELVGELDLLGDRHAVLGDPRRAEALVEHDVAALRTEGDLHRVGQDIDAAQHALARAGAELDVLRSHFRVTSLC